jgi:hypothetical protein
MSDTPRTDEVMKYCFGDDSEFVTVKHYERLQRELAAAQEQRDGAFSLIDYAGELLGVPKQEHKSAHGFAILQAIKKLAATKGGDK